MHVRYRTRSPCGCSGSRNETVDWDELAALEAGGVRIESHGIGHRPLSELEPAEAAREIALSKLRLEERLGREVEAFAFVKGSLADYRPEHASLVQQAGYKIAFTSVSGANALVDGSLSAAPLQRRAVPGTDLRARARRGVRPDRGQGHRDGHARAPRVQLGARHGLEVSEEFTLEPYEPSHRDDYLGLLGDAWGGGAMGGETFDWWFDGDPAGSMRSVAIRDGRVVGVAGHSKCRLMTPRRGVRRAVLRPRRDFARSPRARHLSSARAPARGPGPGAGLVVRARVRERSHAAALSRAARVDADRPQASVGEATAGG